MIATRNFLCLRTATIVFMICSVSFHAQAQFAGGTGQADDPFQIATAEQLCSIGSDPNLLDKHFILVADINLDPNLPNGQHFTRAIVAPDVNDEWDFQGPAFRGSFDGNGCVIRNLTIRGDKTGHIGLFGKIASTGKVYDLHLEDISISNSNYFVGGLVGYNRGNITNCHVSGMVSGGDLNWCLYLSLLAGINRGQISNCDIDGVVSSGDVRNNTHFGLLTGQNKGVISNCYVRGRIEGGVSPSDFGGLVGENLCNIADCYSTVSVSVDSNSAFSGEYGGLVGTNEGVINRCYATGNVSFGKHSDNVGGLVGYNSGNIIGCYATGNVSGDYANDQIGGLVGMNWGKIIHCYGTGNVTGNGDLGGLVGKNRGAISNAYAIGRVCVGDLCFIPMGGLVGGGSNDDVSNCYWDIETSGQTTSEGGEGLSTALMQEPLTFIESGWDFVDEHANGTSDVWQIHEDGGYPELTFFSDEYQPRELSGRGTLDDPYLIATVEDIGAIMHNDCGAFYKLMADVNLAGITWTTAVIPSFAGTFDGNGFTVSNLTIRGGEYLGLFGVLEKNSVVKDLGIKDANIVGGNSASDLGILAVENWGSITNCQITGNVSGGEYEEQYAGIVRYNVGTITNCDPIDYDGPYSVIITDPNETQYFLTFEGIDFDEVWIPEEADLEGLDSVLKTYLESDESSYEHVLDYLPLYSKEYSGFILNDSKYIICQMLCAPAMQGGAWFVAVYDPGVRFAIIFDGGCGIIRIIFDAESKKVVSIDCNGMA